MQKLNRMAREKGWEAALHEVAPQLTYYATSPLRANWMSLLPIKTNWTALDLGAGWGGNAFPLSQRLKHVVALESVFDRAEFIEIRKEQEKRDNVQVVAASIHRIPLPRDRFDLIVMNGLLEWAALSAEGDPRLVQEQVLRSVHDLLAPGGWLYLGIENRFSFQAFLGQPDDSGIPFTSLMPRKVADAYMRLVSARHNRTHHAMTSYRTYTYSYWGYKRLLERCGFKDFQAWGTYTYNKPTLLYNLKDTREFKQYLKSRSSHSTRKKVVRFLAMQGASSSILRLFSPMFCILARK
jgi:SAM-dependent methyltransferase